VPVSVNVSVGASKWKLEMRKVISVMAKDKRMLLPVFFLFVSLILLGKRTFEEAQAGFLSLDNINRIVGLCGALMLVFVSLAKRSTLSVPLPLRWFAMYVGICLLSAVFYSNLVGYSLWKVLEIFAALAVSVYIATHAKKQPGVALAYYETCLAFFVLMIVAAVVGAALNPVAAITPPVSDRSIEAFGEPVVPYQLHGTIFVVNPNTLGAMAAILTFVYLLRIINGSRKMGAFFILFISAGVFLLAQSRTAWAGFFVAFAWYLLLSPNPSRRIRLMLGSLSIIALIGGIGVFTAYLTRGYSIEQLQGMSGRARWWEVAWLRFNESRIDEQLFGLGFMTANRTITFGEIGYSISSLHSDYADALISTGYIGGSLIVLFLVASWFLFGAIIRRSGCLEAEIVGIALILTVRTFTGTTVAIFNSFLVMFFSLVVLCQALRNNQRMVLYKN
jgi:hypothetical protein